MAGGRIRPEPDERAYLVTVDLSALALNLRRWDGVKRDEGAAARWLIQKHPCVNTTTGVRVLEPSPFLATDAFSTFYCREDPHDWLDVDEIRSVKPAKVYHYATDLVLVKKVCMN